MSGSKMYRFRRVELNRFTVLFLAVFLSTAYLFARINYTVVKENTKIFKLSEVRVVEIREKTPDQHVFEGTVLLKKGAMLMEKQVNENPERGGEVNSSFYQLFQPAGEVDFPTVDMSTPRIPHIIHQMYKQEWIPEIYTKNIKSFIKNNPTWEYRFWTDESGRKLLEKHHPYLLNVYDRFKGTVKQSDLLRYAVLYEFGGFYADLDVENLRSLDRTTWKYACILSVEPFEHSVFLYEMEYLINNAIMSCRPKHPFFKQLLTNLEHVYPKGYPVGTTGPGYVTREFDSYNHIIYPHPETKTDLSSNSPYFYKGELKEDDENAVYVPNSQYFMDKIDPIHTKKNGKFTKLCASVERLTEWSHKRACAEFHARKQLRENKKYAYTLHHWYHLWGMDQRKVSKMKTIGIRDIVPNCTLYNDEPFITVNPLFR